MFLSHKIELNPNNHQRTLFKKHAGVARYAFNWGLQVCIEANNQRKAEREETGKAVTKFPTGYDLNKKFNLEQKSTKPWLYEVSKSFT